MELATVREGVNLTNNTKAISPYVLREILKGFSTHNYVKDAIANAEIDPGQVDLSSYAKKTELPKKTSQLENDSNFVSLIDNLIPAQFLPSYVDDVLEFANMEAFPIPGEEGKIYIALDTNKTYRWGGSTYSIIGTSLALGETSQTAYRGDRGKIAYDHSQAKGNPHGLTLIDLSITSTLEELNNLTGLDENIMDLLKEKLDIAGGTITGYLKHPNAPVDKFDVANKLYIDTAINGISIKVTQNVTNIKKLSESMGTIEETLKTQAETLVEVKNSVSGIDQTSKTNSENILNIQKSVEGLSSSVEANSKTITVLQNSLSPLKITVSQPSLFIPVDSANKPLVTATYSIPYSTTFNKVEITPETLTLKGTHEGIELTEGTKEILVSVKKETPILEVNNLITILIEYTDSEFKYSDAEAFIIATLKQGKDGANGKDGTNGKDGQPGKDGENGKDGQPGKDGANGEPGKDAAIQSTTPPVDTDQLWLDLTSGQLKQYIKNPDGTGQWYVVNDYSQQLKDANDKLAGLNQELNNKVDELNKLIKDVETNTSTKITQAANKVEIEFKKTEKEISNIAGKISEHITEQNRYIRFIEGTITLGDANNPYILSIYNNKISIQKGQDIISSWIEDTFQVKKLNIKEKAWEYYFTLVPLPNGSVSLRREEVSGEASKVWQ